ncbi:hypothetical protein [Streptodolium elevatio]
MSRFGDFARAAFTKVTGRGRQAANASGPTAAPAGPGLTNSADLEYLMSMLAARMKAQQADYERLAGAQASRIQGRDYNVPDYQVPHYQVPDYREHRGGESVAAHAAGLKAEIQRETAQLRAEIQRETAHMRAEIQGNAAPGARPTGTRPGAAPTPPPAPAPAPAPTPAPTPAAAPAAEPPAAAPTPEPEPELIEHATAEPPSAVAETRSRDDWQPEAEFSSAAPEVNSASAGMDFEPAMSPGAGMDSAAKIAAAGMTSMAFDSSRDVAPEEVNSVEVVSEMDMGIGVDAGAALEQRLDKS